MPEKNSLLHSKCAILHAIIESYNLLEDWLLEFHLFHLLLFLCQELLLFHLFCLFQCDDTVFLLLFHWLLAFHKTLLCLLFHEFLLVLCCLLFQSPLLLLLVLVHGFLLLLLLQETLLLVFQWPRLLLLLLHDDFKGRPNDEEEVQTLRVVDGRDHELDDLKLPPHRSSLSWLSSLRQDDEDLQRLLPNEWTPRWPKCSSLSSRSRRHLPPKNSRLSSSAFARLAQSSNARICE